MEVLFARFEHGGHKIIPNVENDKVRGMEVLWPGGPKKYLSNRQALIALVNGVPDPTPGLRDPKITFDRYFRRGRYQRETSYSWDIFSLFRPEEPALSKPKAPPLITGSGELSILNSSKTIDLGIDLGKRGHEVRKLFYAGFARSLARKGYDPEDVLQELYKALLIRNRGKCPWDSRKSSFGHYIHMVANCVISNYLRRYGRLEKNEVFGYRSPEGEEIDVSESNLTTQEATQGDEFEYLRTREEILGLVLMEAPNRGVSKQLAEELFLLMSDGSRGRDLKKGLNHPPEKVNEAVSLVRDIARLWKSRVSTP